MHVAARVSAKKTSVARNLPNTNSRARIGKVNSNSHVFSLRSSAQTRIVTAGMNTHIISGMFPKNDRMSATGNVKNDVMYNPTLIARKTIMKI